MQKVLKFDKKILHYHINGINLYRLGKWYQLQAQAGVKNKKGPSEYLNQFFVFYNLGTVAGSDIMD